MAANSSAEIHSGSSDEEGSFHWVEDDEGGDVGTTVPSTRDMKSTEVEDHSLQGSSTPLYSLGLRDKIREDANANPMQSTFNGIATSTPLLSRKSNSKMMQLDLTEIGEDVSDGHLNVTPETKITYSEGSNDTSKTSSRDSACELQEDLQDDEYSEEGAAGGSATNDAPRNKQSPDIDAITEKLRNQHLGDRKPLTKLLPLQSRKKLSVSDTISKLAKAEETMPSVDEGQDFSPPKRLKVNLYSHQIYGARWMSWRENQYPGGGILADEMGLGKTVISIAVILMGMESGPGEDSENWYSAESKKLVPTNATLVICPPTCMDQWEKELQTKAKGLKITVYHGRNRDKSAALLAQNDVVITSYPTVGSEVTKLTDDPYNRCESPLLRLHWERIMLDEGHIIRNPKTLGAQAVCRLTARHRWVVTGTPVHNTPEDFFSLMKFLQLSPFDDPEVWNRWIGLKVVHENNKARLHTIGKAMVLRRTKIEVQKADSNMVSIPSKTVQDIILEMRAPERAVYDHLQEFAKQQFKKFLEAQADRRISLQGAAYTYQGGKAKKKVVGVQQAEYKFSNMLVLLTRLRQSSVLPFLIQTMLDDDEEDGDASYDALNDPINANNPVFEPGYKSSKILAVKPYTDLGIGMGFGMELEKPKHLNFGDLKKLKEEGKANGVPMDKVIIVSQWTTLLDILAKHLKNEGFTFSSITGKNTVEDRKTTVEKFNANPKRPQVLLLSMGAGGVGLNLVGANHVFFLEPHWNPQMERQAQGRVHRLGQTKPVFIKRYIVKDTIESRVLDLQSQKLELSDGLLDNTKKGTGAALNVAAIKTLFGL